jgi:hypothetical protein
VCERETEELIVLVDDSVEKKWSRVRLERAHVVINWSTLLMWCLNVLFYLLCSVVSTREMSRYTKGMRENRTKLKF